VNTILKLIRIFQCSKLWLSGGNGGSFPNLPQTGSWNCCKSAEK